MSIFCCCTCSARIEQDQAKVNHQPNGAQATLQQVNVAAANAFNQDALPKVGEHYQLIIDGKPRIYIVEFSNSTGIGLERQNKTTNRRYSYLSNPKDWPNLQKKKIFAGEK